MGTKTAILAAVLSAIAPMQVVMANEPGLSAQDVVRRYSKTVACQIHEESPQPVRQGPVGAWHSRWFWSYLAGGLDW